LHLLFSLFFSCRQWIQSSVVKFAEVNPALSIKTLIKRSQHPYIRGHYGISPSFNPHYLILFISVNGKSKTICIKNLDPEEIEEYILDLRNQAGYKVTADRYKKSVISKHPSVQGEWHEKMSLCNIPLVVENVYPKL